MVVGEAYDFAFQCVKIIKSFFRSAEGVAERKLRAWRERANIHRAFEVYQRKIESAKCLDKRPGHFRPGLRADRLQPGRRKKNSRDNETCRNGNLRVGPEE